jgi:hypothetical protein
MGIILSKIYSMHSSFSMLIGFFFLIDLILKLIKYTLKINKAKKVYSVVMEGMHGESAYMVYMA